MSGNKKVAINIEEDVRIAIHYMIDKFVQDEKQNELDFPASFTNLQRAYIHEYVKNKSLKSKSHGKGNQRYLTIYKMNILSMVYEDATIELSDKSKKIIVNLLKKQPLSQREKTDLRRRKIVQNSLASYTLNLGSLNCSRKCIPPPPNPSQVILQERINLPISYYKESIINGIKQNQVLIISGSTGSGKTTQVPQYIMEDAFQNNECCRIICTQPRRLSAVTVSERVSYERGNPLGQTVGYQIRLESRLSPTTNLILCTNGVLLRCLMGKNNKDILNDITHIIVDEVHERDQHSDFLLITLKEKLMTNPNLKIILMSATIESNTFSEYFNKCPVIEIPGRLYPVDNYFLDDILANVECYNDKIMDLKKQAKIVGKHPDTLRAPVPFMDEETTSLMNDILELCWMENNIEDFNQFFYLVEDENNPIDFQHTETEMTALMIAAAKGYTKVVEKLLNMGADPFIKGRHSYTALDWSISMNNFSKCTKMIEYAMNHRQRNMETPFASKNINKLLLDTYHASVNDEKIDHKLIFDVIKYIHCQMPTGSILIFLPGYDDILEQQEMITNRMSNQMGYKIYLLHSNMQTNDQKSVFKPLPHLRKIILSTNIAETSITIDDVVYVIDTGKAKMKHFDSVSATTSLTATWISQACAKQRAGRAGRTSPGICYRLYSRARYEAMEKFTLPEILRVPLTEICLQTAIIASKTSILNFLSKAIQPPSTMSIKQSIKLLQKLGALDEDESLTELGILLADLPVDVRLGKILVYGILMRCIDPILTIVSALSVNDPFVLPSNFFEKDKAAKVKKELSEGSFSDCLCLLRVFQKWNEMKSSFKEKQFCNRNFLNSGTMDTISSLRAKILGHLRSIGLVKSHGSGTIQELNQNSYNWSLVKACLTAGLYPNVCRVDREYATIKTRIDKKISPHPSSVIRDKTLKQNKENILSFPSEWIVFEEKTRSGTHCLIKCNTIITPITVALFCGSIFLDEKENLISFKDNDYSDNNIDIVNSPDNKTKLIVDDWINFVIDSQTAYSIFNLRQKLSSLFFNFVSNPKHYTVTSNDSQLINTVSKLLEEEDEYYKFPRHNDVGLRPRPTMQSNGSSSSSNFPQQDHKLFQKIHNNYNINPKNNSNNINNNINSRNSFDFNNDWNNHLPQHLQQQQQQFQQQHQATNLIHRYYIVKAASLEQVEKIKSCNSWGSSSSILSNLTRICRKSPNVRIIIFFQISSIKCFCGAANFEMVNNRHHLTLLSAKQITFDEMRNKGNEFLKFDGKSTFDGEELPETLGRLFLSLF